MQKFRRAIFERVYLEAVQLAGPVLGLVLVLAIFSLLSHRPGEPLVFLSLDNFKDVAVQTTVLAICGIGMTLVIIAGGIDLSIGSIVALSNVTVVLVFNGAFFDTVLRVCFGKNVALAWATAVILSVLTIGIRAWRSRNVLPTVIAVAASWLAGWLVFGGSLAVAAFCAGTLIGLACGWINGLLVTATGVVPFIITLGTMEAFRGLTQLLAGSTTVSIDASKEAALEGDSAWLRQLATQDPEPTWLVVGPGVWLLVISAILAVVMLSRLRLGRYIFAVGSNEEAGRLSGLNVAGVKRWVYSLAGLSAGVAGVIEFSRQSNASPSVHVGLELDVIAAVVIGGGSLRGGQGSILGTIIGAFILRFMRTGCTLSGISEPVQRILVGAIIILAVAIDEWRHRRR